MCAVRLLRVSVRERLGAAAEDVLLRVEKGEEAAEVAALRALLTERLAAAAEEIVGLFEETVAGYEERAERSEREICRQRRLLDAVLKPQVKLHRADGIPPEQHEWRSSLDQEDPDPPHIKEEQLQGLEEADMKVFTPVKSDDDEEETRPSQLHQRQTEQMETEDVQQQKRSSSLAREDPEPPLIKEEQEELCTSLDREPLQGLEEADITKFTFTPMKSEDDEEEAQSSQLHRRQTEQMETEGDGEDCGGPEPDRNPGLYRHPQLVDKDEDSSEPGTDNSDDWKETREPGSGLNSFSGSICSSVEKPFSCCECEKRFSLKTCLNRHMRSHNGEKPFSCSVCKKSFGRRETLQTHIRIHTGEKPFSCALCDKRFLRKAHLKRHMMTHTGEKPYSCSVCGKSFTQAGSLRQHMSIHTGDKLYNCSVCNRRFPWYTSFKHHQYVCHRSFASSKTD
uniref:C2H2-type domain-containing protein n=1 Tax=Gasterosteus aculeatus aculeatus TaxID=481459 RepID=A0AAQ4PGK7_GASAC|nr:zinc finger and SCAN domain-containing protein 2-like [Gasterosteus aculeatus aculeatus]XP_040045237.1 zinc finger and SCAN domain-containing protein 2-like [Gasterosteus aculeatus aculeatus]XP_040045238.1 zinc finger and SCAN domain-containing protein 2-like [Gasterosteus aculeatus aculeatus]